MIIHLIYFEALVISFHFCSVSCVFNACLSDEVLQMNVQLFLKSFFIVLYADETQKNNKISCNDSS